MLHVGLRAIARRMGVKDKRTILRWNDRLSFPLFMHPSSKLRGRHIVFCTDDEVIVRWELACGKLDMKHYWKMRKHHEESTSIKAPASGTDIDG